MTRGAFWFDPGEDGGDPFWWPYCEIPGCPNGICFAIRSERFCWPHSDSGTTVEEMIEVQRLPQDSGLVPITPEEEARYLMVYGRIMVLERDGVRYRVLAPEER